MVTHQQLKRRIRGKDETRCFVRTTAAQKWAAAFFKRYRFEFGKKKRNNPKARGSIIQQRFNMKKKGSIGRWIGINLLLLGFFASAEPRQITNSIPDDARRALESADKMELFSIDPRVDKEPPKDSFRGRTILGKMRVANKKMQKELASALEKGVITDRGLLISSPVCFNPRHGLRFSSSGRTFDFLICFECERVGVSEHGNTNTGFFRIYSTPQPVFDKVLTDAKIPLASKP